MRLALFASLMAFPAFGQTGSECAVIATDSERLACYDDAFRPSVASTPVEGVGSWDVELKTSAFEDTQDVYMSVSSKDPVLCSSYGQPSRLKLWIRCMENTTAVYISGDCHLTSGHGGYGQVDFRTDDRKPVTTDMDASTNNRALGHWRGGASIPFIKRNILDGDTLLVRFAPYNMSRVTAEFDISGVSEAIAPLREACGW
jgi:type VI secretion system protein VasI